MNRVLLAMLSLFSVGGMCPAGPPPPDSCGSPSARTTGELQIGPELFDMRGFEAWAAEDTAYVTEGAQGGYMLGVTLRLPAGAPSCLKQTTSVSEDGRVLAAEDSALNTYEAVDGTRTTKTAWLVFDDTGPAVGSQVTVKTVAAGHTLTRTLTIAQDRHRLESVSVIGTPAVGTSFEIELKVRISPIYGGIAPMYSYSNPGVISVTPPEYVYADVERFSATALTAGQTDFIVTFRDQEVRVPITVAP